MAHEVWDDYWSSLSVEHALERVFEEERSCRFRRIVAALEARLGTIRASRCVELGAGAGTTSIALARLGAEVTLVDRSEPALLAARAATEAAAINATVAKADLFAPPERHRGRYDVAMSFGVAEHFAGDERREVVAAHLRWVRPGGVAVVAVPNRFCVSYRLWKWWLVRTNRWTFGYEEPFSPVGLRALAKQAGGTDVEIFGSSAMGDALRFVTPMVAFRLTGGRARLPRLEVPSRLDPVLGYAISAVFARKAG